MFDEIPEQQIPPPSDPLTVKINLAILDFVFKGFAARFLPAFEVSIASDYRTKEHNDAVGGAANSAHVHGLAYDVILKQGGKVIPKPMAQKVFSDFIKPNWPGFALFEEADRADSSWHIHLNLPRNVTLYAGMISVSAMGVIGFMLYKLWREK